MRERFAAGLSSEGCIPTVGAAKQRACAWCSRIARPVRTTDVAEGTRGGSLLERSSTARVVQLENGRAVEGGASARWGVPEPGGRADQGPADRSSDGIARCELAHRRCRETRADDKDPRGRATKDALNRSRDPGSRRARHAQRHVAAKTGGNFARARSPLGRLGERIRELTRSTSSSCEAEQGERCTTRDPGKWSEHGAARADDEARQRAIDCRRATTRGAVARRAGEVRRATTRWARSIGICARRRMRAGAEADGRCPRSPSRASRGGSASPAERIEREATRRSCDRADSAASA